MSVCCECCVLSVRGLCDGLLTCTEESYGCLSVLSVVFCQVEFARRADHLYRRVLWMSVCCECCLLLGRDLYVGLITFTEESYGCLSVVSFVFCQLDTCA